MLQQVGFQDYQSDIYKFVCTSYNRRMPRLSKFSGFRMVFHGTEGNEDIIYLCSMYTRTYMPTFCEYACTHTHKCSHTYAHRYRCLHTHTRAHVHVHTFKCIHTKRACTHARTHTYIYTTHTNTRTHSHLYTINHSNIITSIRTQIPVVTGTQAHMQMITAT